MLTTSCPTVNPVRAVLYSIDLYIARDSFSDSHSIRISDHAHEQKARVLTRWSGLLKEGKKPPLPETCDDTPTSQGAFNLTKGQQIKAITQLLPQLPRCLHRRSPDFTLTLRPSRAFTTAQDQSITRLSRSWRDSEPRKS